MPLADFQAQVRGAIIGGERSSLAPAALFGGRDPAKRFEIHRRHYEASLVRALAEKFPALVWLVGSPFVTERARAFVHQFPPRAPCIAEYGEDFPAFLAGQAEAERVPWLRSVGELEWRLGRAALAVEHAPLTLDAVAAVDPAWLADCVFTMQPGLHYLAAPWPVDELVKLFLSDSAPQSYALEAEDIGLEVRGARGSFAMTRLDAGAFAFRKALASHATIGLAAEQALDADPGFDAGCALLQLIAAGLATGIGEPVQGGAS